ncbi:MAG: hypothetical protein JSV32_01875 [Dehalococcoidia bacterium]|nr:MAG: hypothetical protein JSV32_01875 [Dehalococcoidia bacterium]
MSIINRIGDIDRRYLYLLLIILVGVPLLRPIGLPIPISSMTRDLYTELENLPPGSVILQIINIGPAQLSDCGVGTLALTKHIFTLDLKWVGVSQAADGAMIYEYIMNKIGQPSGKTYGENWVYLGYAAGGEAMQASLATDFATVFPIDFYGTPVGEIPLMSEVRTHEDIDMVIIHSNSGDQVEGLLRQWQSPYNTVCVANVGSVMGPSMLPYYPNQLLSVLVGMSAGAEYELVAGVPGPGLSSADAMSMGNILVIAFLLLGNISLLLEKSGGKRD